MSAVAAIVASRQPSIHLKASLAYEDYTTVRLSHSWDENAGTAAVPRWTTRTRKADVPFAPDSSDKERLLRVVHEYKDSITESRLHFTTGDEVYDNFRLTLGGDLRTTWDQTVTDLEATQVAGAAWTKTTDNFTTDGIPRFLRRFFPSNAYLIQGEYMRLAIKPKALDVYALSGRMRLINTLSQYLPGSGGTRLYTTDTEEKNAFFRMMLPSWQLKFSETGFELDDQNYNYDRLVQFMANQQLYYDAEQEANRQRRQQLQNNNRYGQRQQYRPFQPPRQPPGALGPRSFGNPSPRGGRGPGNRTFTPHRNNHSPHQTPFRPGNRGGRGGRGFTPFRGTPTTRPPRTRYQAQQQQRNTRSGRAYGQQNPARRSLFYVDDTDLYYHDEPEDGDVNAHYYDEEDQFFASQPPNPDTTTFAAASQPNQEHHYSSTAAAPAPEEDQFLADAPQNMDAEEYYDDNEWLQDY